MKPNFNTLVIVCCTVAIILFISAALPKPSDQNEVPIVRASKFELVDKKGTVRGSMKIEDDGAAVFRLMDESGTIRVKLAADQEGSGLVLLDGATNPGIHALTTNKETFLTLSKEGVKKEIKP